MASKKDVFTDAVSIAELKAKEIKEEVSAIETKVSELTERKTEIEGKITSIISSGNVSDAVESKRELRDIEDSLDLYEMRLQYLKNNRIELYGKEGAEMVKYVRDHQQQIFDKAKAEIIEYANKIESVYNDAIQQIEVGDKAIITWHEGVCKLTKENMNPKQKLRFDRGTLDPYVNNHIKWYTES